MTRSDKIPRKLIHEFVDLAHFPDQIARIEAMLQEYPDLARTPRPGKDKETAIGAAIHGPALKEEYIQFWLDRGNEMDVFVACRLRRYDVLETLLAAKPELIASKARYAHNCDLIDLAPDQKMVDYLINQGYPMSVLVAAAKGLIEKVVDYLEEDPESVNVTDNEGKQPLHVAIVGGRDDVAELLIRKGADVTHSCRINCRPLSYACIWGRDRIVSLLLENDTDINFIGTGYDLSYLQCAVNWPMGGIEANLRIIRMLMDSGVDPAITDKQGLTAYDMAVEHGHEGKEMAELIISLISR